MVYTRDERRKYQAEYRRKRRDKAIALLGGKCIVCGTTEDLEFNHIDPNTKRFQLATWDGKQSLYWEEVLKCNLLCKTHHDEETARQWQAGMLQTPVAQRLGL